MCVCMRTHACVCTCMARSDIGVGTLNIEKQEDGQETTKTVQNHSHINQG